MSGAIAQADAAKAFADQRANALVGGAPDTTRPTRRAAAPHVGYAPPWAPEKVLAPPWAPEKVLAPPWAPEKVLAPPWAPEKVLAASAAWQLACTEALSPPKGKSFKGRLKGGAAALLAAQRQLHERERALTKLEESEKAKKQVRLIALDCSSLDCH